MPLLFIINPGRRDLGIFTKTTILLQCSLVNGRICFNLIHCTFAISSHNKCIKLKATVKSHNLLNDSFNEKSEFESKAADPKCPNTSAIQGKPSEPAGLSIFVVGTPFFHYFIMSFCQYGLKIYDRLIKN